MSGSAALLTREVSWLRLRGDDDAQGIGEASAVDWLTQRSSGAALRELHDIAAQIVGVRPLASELLARSFDPSLSCSVRAGLQCALLDLEARRRGISLARLLGAAADATLAVSALLTGDGAAAISEAARYASAGFTAVKLKVGAGSVADDVARVLAVRAAAGAAARLRLDANGAWNGADAETALRALKNAGVDFIEEPLGDTSSSRLAVLRSLRKHVAVAVDESIVTARDLDAVIAGDAADVLVLKLERVGGPLPALALATAARRGGLRVVFTDSIESAVGRAATAHVALAAGADEALGLGGEFFLAAGAGIEDVARDAAGAGAAQKAAAESAARDLIRGDAAQNAASVDATPRPWFEIRGPGLGVESGRA